MISCGLAGVAILGACDRPGPDRETPAEPFVIASGPDGVALTDGQWLEKVFEPAPDEGFTPGPLAVPLPGGRAAVVQGGRIAVVQPHTAAVIRECADCSGVGWTGREIVTTRRSPRPDNSFDIVSFSADLQQSRSVPAGRKPERVTTDYPQENIESPTTLVASPDRITVAYLSRDGGVRRGPSTVAHYAADGRLMDSAEVNGVIRTSVVSPDGGHLALGVGGSGGACIVSADLTVIDLADLHVLDIGPPLPDTFTGDVDASWSYATDMVWRDGRIFAVARLHTLDEAQQCDPDPQLWTRTVDPVTLDVTDADRADADASRWVGPGCDDVVTVTSRTAGAELPETEYELVARIGSASTPLGSYSRLTLGGAAGAQCP